MPHWSNSCVHSEGIHDAHPPTQKRVSKEDIHRAIWSWDRDSRYKSSSTGIAPALVETIRHASLRQRLKQEGGITRSHSLAEVFSALTGGNINLRVGIGPVQRQNDCRDLAKELSFFDLAPADVLMALKEAKEKGVRGGRVHDYLHAIAAEKAGVKELLTLDRNDFVGLTKVPVSQV